MLLQYMPELADNSDVVVERLFQKDPDYWHMDLSQLFEQFYRGTDGDYLALLTEAREHAFRMARRYAYIAKYLSEIEAGEDHNIALTRAAVYATRLENK